MNVNGEQRELFDFVKQYITSSVYSALVQEGKKNVGVVKQLKHY